MRILIVDDSPLVRSVLKGFLQEAGYDVYEAENISEAKVMFVLLRPHLIIKDLYMQGWDPVESINYFKKINSKVKIIICSTHNSKDLILESLKAGANDYILKPLEKDNVLALVDKVTAI
ncbi:MAG TPA: response regulator [Bacillota bacterium]|jgi:two-component system chemotaxis response regulator CheY|nr:response regulator [Bacillota bacterium]HOL10902.1 response regulator [Bacillota bacterium]HPO98073.1 response regulator [Bacillota bacterium]